MDQQGIKKLFRVLSLLPTLAASVHVVFIQLGHPETSLGGIMADLTVIIVVGLVGYCIVWAIYNGLMYLTKDSLN